MGVQAAVTPRHRRDAVDLAVMRRASRVRCAWALGGGPSIGSAYVDYHDTVWGVPERDERTLFEFLILEGAQAGLSWSTILRKIDVVPRWRSPGSTSKRSPRSATPTSSAAWPTPGSSATAAR